MNYDSFLTGIFVITIFCLIAFSNQKSKSTATEVQNSHAYDPFPHMQDIVGCNVSTLLVGSKELKALENRKDILFLGLKISDDAKEISLCWEKK